MLLHPWVERGFCNNSYRIHPHCPLSNSKAPIPEWSRRNVEEKRRRRVSSFRTIWTAETTRRVWTSSCRTGVTWTAWGSWSEAFVLWQLWTRGGLKPEIGMGWRQLWLLCWHSSWQVSSEIGKRWWWLGCGTVTRVERGCRNMGRNRKWGKMRGRGRNWERRQETKEWRRERTEL